MAIMRDLRAISSGMSVALDRVIHAPSVVNKEPSVVNKDMFCWYCYTADLRPSLPRWYDILLCRVFRGRAPFRCRNCRGRQWLRYTEPTQSSSQ